MNVQALTQTSPRPDAAPTERPWRPVETGALHAECVDVLRLTKLLPAWGDLCARAIEPNIFLDPAFALPLFQHACASAKPRFLLVWEENGPVTFGRLLGLFVVDRPWRRGGLCRLRFHNQTSNGTPLVDRDRALEVIGAALAWLGADRRRPSQALALSSLRSDGPFAQALAEVCERSSRALAVLDGRTRAVLHRPDAGDDRVACFASARRRQQHGRQARRLAKAGKRTLTSARTPSEIGAATERFLELEQRSWKGARGTALLSDPALATFTRTMTRQLAAAGRCRIDAVEVDGRPIAIGIVLVDGDRAYFWKIAFDEAYAIYSPGVQLALEVTQQLLADPAVGFTDSCSEPDNPMIDKLWPDRVTMVDVIVAVSPGRRGRFASLLRVERARRAARRLAKSLYRVVRRRLRD